MERGHEDDHHEQSKQRPWTTSFDLVSLLNENQCLGLKKLVLNQEILVIIENQRKKKVMLLKRENW